MAENWEKFTAKLALFAALLAGLLVTPGGGGAIAAPDRWRAHDPQSTLTVDHGPFDALLSAHVKPGPDGINRVDYAALADDGPALAAYLEALQQVPVSGLARPEQLAYWLNLYNALTLQVVIRHYPVGTIRDIDISPGLFANGPWGAELALVEGEPLSLDDIEHGILRPIWQDPRIHYGVNCASIGCPNLLTEAYRGTTVDAQLTANARAYINHPRGARFDGDRLTVSRIYGWFEEDFGGSEAGVLAHLRRYAEPGLAAALKTIEDIDAYAYDWALNDAAAAPGDGAT